MMPLANNTKDLLNVVVKSGLYEQFIQQIQKDFQLSGIPVDLNLEIKPEDLVQKITTIVSQTLERNFDTYLQLLYRVDINEQTMQTNQVQSLAILARKASLKILQREWMKVFFRNKYG